MQATRSAFRAALAEVRRFEADGFDRMPAFLSPLAAPPRRHLRSRADARRRAQAGPSPGTIAAARLALEQGSLTAETLMAQTLAAIRRGQGLNAFTYVAPDDDLLAEARRLDQLRRAGRTPGLLHGIPVSVKDVIHVKGMPTTASSRVLQNWVPSEDATAVRRLRETGAIVVGKTQTHEFALGVTTPQSRNPWDRSRDPGGSSGGSAISVAAGMSLAGLGTDTRASIRVPAALCGVVGYKPTFGLIPVQGVVVLSWSMDHVALHTRSASDAAVVMGAMRPDVPRERRGRGMDFTQEVGRGAQGLRLGLPVHALDGADSQVLARFDESVHILREAGAEVMELDTPSQQDFHLANAMGLVLSRCEAVAYHRSFHASPDQYTAPVREQLEEAASVSAADYLNTQRFRSQFRDRMLALFDGVDALVMPTTRVAAPRLDESERFLLVLSENCIPWSFIGVPAISVPCGLTASGLPVGIQFVAPPFDDAFLLGIADAFEGLADGARLQPPSAADAPPQ